MLSEYFFDLFEQSINYAQGDGVVLVWIGIGSVLALTGIGFPSPEDIPLTLAGFLTYKTGFFGIRGGPPEFIWWEFLIVVTFCGACNVIGDMGAYWAGRKWGMPVREKVPILKKLITDKAVLKVEGWFTKYGSLTVVIGRLFAGVRLVTFFTAGTVKMRFRSFVLWDFVGCYLSIPAWLGLGAWGATVYGTEGWIEFKEWFNEAGWIMILIAGSVVASVYIYFKFIRKEKEDDIPLEEVGRQHHEKVEHDEEVRAAKKEAKRSARLEKVAQPKPE